MRPTMIKQTNKNATRLFVEMKLVRNSNTAKNRNTKILFRVDISGKISILAFPFDILILRGKKDNKLLKVAVDWYQYHKKWQISKRCRKAHGANGAQITQEC